MTDNDLFYVCSLIEYIARKTTNTRGAVVRALTVDGVERQLQNAPCNHCLTFEEVAYETIEEYGITNGSFDTITNCEYPVPNFQDIGKLYAIVIEALPQTAPRAEMVYNVFNSFLSDAISNFNSDLYYQNPGYLVCCYQEGEIIFED